MRCSEQLRQWGKRGLSPSGEEDRKLPLHKLFENLQEYEQTMPALVSDVELAGCIAFQTYVPSSVGPSVLALCTVMLLW